MATEQNEKREYFRIDDQAYIDIDQLPADTTLSSLLQEHSSFLINSDISAISLEHKAIFTKIKRTNPDLALYLGAIDKKIELLSKHILETSSEFINKSKVDIELSASGISLENPGNFKKDDLIMIKLYLFPEQYGLICTGKVIRINTINTSHILCIDFEEILDSDREIIIKHTITKQLSQVRPEEQ